MRWGEAYFAYNDGVLASVLVTGTERSGVLVELAAGYNVVASPLAQPLAVADVVDAATVAGGEVPYALGHAGSRFLAYVAGAPQVSSAESWRGPRSPAT